MRCDSAVVNIIITFFIISVGESATLQVGTDDEDYRNIEDAIEAAQPGDRIEVSAGIYKENLVVDKPLSMVGIGQTVIDAGGDYMKGSAIKLTADGVLVKGFTIVNSTNAAGDPYAGAGIEIRSDNNILRNNTIRHNYRSGIKIFSGKNNTIVDNSIQNNYEGILMAESTDNNVMANRIINNSGSGVSFIMNSFNNSIQENVIAQNFVGIVSDSPGFNKISQNNFYNNQEARIPINLHNR